MYIIATFLDALTPVEWTAIGTAIAAVVSALGGLIYKFRVSKKIDFKGASKILNESRRLVELIKGKRRQRKVA